MNIKNQEPNTVESSESAESYITCLTSPAASNAANHSSENGAAFMGGFITRPSCFLSIPDFLLQQKPVAFKLLRIFSSKQTL